MLWLFVIMLVLFAVSTPIGWSMAIAAALYMAVGPHIPLQGMVQRMIGGIAKMLLHQFFKKMSKELTGQSPMLQANEQSANSSKEDRSA